MERSALSALGALLDWLGIRWVLIGALAANRYRASPRLTQDVDLLLADSGPGIDVLESALRDAGWMLGRASPEGELLRLRHPELGIADLMIAGTDYQREAMRRARRESFGEGASADRWRLMQRRTDGRRCAGADTAGAGHCLRERPGRVAS